MSPFLVHNLVLFGRLLRDLGLAVHPDQLITLVRGLEQLDIGAREDFKNATRAALAHRKEHWELFDRAFDLFWKVHPEPGSRIELGRMLQRSGVRQGRVAVLGPAGEDRRQARTGREISLVEPRLSYSPREVLRYKDFAELTEQERRDVERFIRAWAFDVERKRTRRQVRARSGPYPDMRRTIRGSLRYGGEPLRLAWLDRKHKPRPLVVLCDVSGSMEPYSRILLQFLYAATRSSRRVESFAFGTRLTRITRQLRGRDVDRALRAATDAVVDWGGGTRIGESLKRFNYDWGRRVLGQGAVVAIISDGWDRGDVRLLETEFRRLKRSCWRLVWLNPLLGLPNYEPLTRGIRAVLPHVDEFLPVHNLDSLERLGKLLERLGSPRWSARSSPAA